MNAETGTEPEAPKRRGRIPQSAWPRILERYRSGATLSAIAREFECTPSAISYIVRKAEASGMLGEGGEIPEGAADSDAESEADDNAGDGAGDDVGNAVETRAETAEPPPPPPPPPARPAQTETLKLSRPDPAPQPAPPPVAEPAPAAAPQRPAAQAGSRPEPTPPVDAVEARLRETARGCLAAYRSWRQQPGEGSIQSLSDAVHDLRKALARIEIDMSASRREEQAIRPIPIPAHRAARRPQ